MGEDLIDRRLDQCGAFIMKRKSERLRGLQWLGLVCAFAAVAFALREGFVSGSTGSALYAQFVGN